MEDWSTLIVARARAQIGMSVYKLRADSEFAPHIVDCSSFTRWAYGLLGWTIPRLAFQQFESCGTHVLPEAAAPGSLVFQRHHYSRSSICPVLGVGHVGLLTGDKSVVHASKKAGTVVEESVEAFYGRFCSSVIAAGIPRITVTQQPLHTHVWESCGKLGRDKYATQTAGL